MYFNSTALAIDPGKEIASITASLRKSVRETLHRKGAVLGVSGGIDSSVCAALCVKAFGANNVLAIFMPERDSSGESLRLGKLLTDQFGIPSLIEDMTPLLEGAGCYRRQTEAIQLVFPEFGPQWKFKITLPSLLENNRLNVARLTIEMPSGETKTQRMSYNAYFQLIAATNFKQRTRKMMEYYHADRMNFAVCGTPNRLEYDQGFFVKNGDGSADIKPIAHLYKTQVYDLARALGIPEEICSRPPTTDTFSMSQTQEEFYFSLPYHTMDLCLYALNNNISSSDVASVIGLTTEQVERVFADIHAKRRATLPLHLSPLLSGEVKEISHR
ncbi:MAG: NAD(+) synthase [Bacteroidota bacterium]|nr:NAD(+) synthase [Bacteroidota bacterium]